MRILHVAASVTLAIVPLALGSTVIACPNGRFGTCIDQWSSSWSVDRTLRRHWTSVITPGARLDQARGEGQIVEFSDYECAACRVAYLSITRVVDSGRGPGIVYRHFPLPGNAMASEAARASICAEQQGRFHAMHALLFERNEWRSGTTWSREA